MAKYKILKEFTLSGVVQKVDSIVELDYVKANLKSIQGNIERVPDNVATPKDGSVLGGIVPGVQLTPEQKAKLAKENEAITAETQKLAAEARERDRLAGNATPVVSTVANALKEQLENKFPAPAPVPPAPETPPATPAV